MRSSRVPAGVRGSQASTPIRSAIGVTPQRNRGSAAVSRAVGTPTLASPAKKNPYLLSAESTREIIEAVRLSEISARDGGASRGLEHALRMLSSRSLGKVVLPLNGEPSLLCYIARQGSELMLSSLLAMGLDLASSPYYNQAIEAAAGASPSRVGASNLALVLGANPTQPIPSPFFSAALTAAAKAQNLACLQLLISTQRCRCNALFAAENGSSGRIMMRDSHKLSATPRSATSAGDASTESRHQAHLRLVLDTQLGAALGASAATSASAVPSATAVSSTSGSSAARGGPLAITCGLDLLRLTHLFDPPLQLFFDDVLVVVAPPPSAGAAIGLRKDAAATTTIRITRCPALDAAAASGHFAACRYLSELHSRTPTELAETNVVGVATRSSMTSSSSSSPAPAPLYSSSFILTGGSNGLQSLRCFLEGAQLDPNLIRYETPQYLLDTVGATSGITSTRGAGVVDGPLEGQGSVLWHALRLYNPQSIQSEACLDLLLDRGARITMPDSIQRFLLQLETGAFKTPDGDDGSSLPHLPQHLFVRQANPSAQALLGKLRQYHQTDPSFGLFERYLTFLLVDSTKKWREIHRRTMSDLLGPSESAGNGENDDETNLFEDASELPEGLIAATTGTAGAASVAGMGTTTPRRKSVRGGNQGAVRERVASSSQHRAASPSPSPSCSSSHSDVDVSFRSPLKARSRLGSLAATGGIINGVGGGAAVVGGTGLAVDLGISISAGTSEHGHHSRQPSGAAAGHGAGFPSTLASSSSSGIFNSLLIVPGSSLSAEQQDGPLATLTPVMPQQQLPPPQPTLKAGFVPFSPSSSSSLEARSGTRPTGGMTTTPRRSLPASTTAAAASRPSSVASSPGLIAARPPPAPRSSLPSSLVPSRPSTPTTSATAPSSKGGRAVAGAGAGSGGISGSGSPRTPTTPTRPPGMAGAASSSSSSARPSPSANGVLLSPAPPPRSSSKLAATPHAATSTSGMGVGVGATARR
jgi:hypothetical protein